MARIYATLKRQVVTGAFVPGARLDPARLQDDLGASTMPIRDALQRLTGEGLVENPQNEGFRVVQLSESGARDLYEWCADIVRICLATADHPADAPSRAQTDTSYAEEVTRLMLRIACLSLNHERRRAMMNLCERGFLLRVAEEKLIDNPFADIAILKNALEKRDWKEASKIFDRFHESRIAILPSAVASMRDHIVDDRSVIF